MDLTQRQDPAVPRKVRLAEHIWMNLYWFGSNVHWAALLGIIIPSQVEKLLGAKEQNLPWVVAAGTIVAVLVHPLAGAVSDRVRSRWGRRRPFLLWGTLINVLALLYMATTHSLLAMALAFILVQVGNNIAGAPWVAIIADRVPAGQRGTASGWYGFMGVVGSIVGFIITGGLLDKRAPLDVYQHQLFTLYGLVAAIQGVTALLSWWGVREEPGTGGPRLTWAEFTRLFWVNPRQHPNFFWVYITRFFMQQGQWAIFFFLQYFFDDVMHLPGEATTSRFNTAVFATATLAVLTAGVLSDRWGRKALVYLAGGLMTVVAAIFALLPRPELVLATGLIFGLGYGVYASVDQALATDVLPHQEDYGKDMGIWQVASILPQITGVIIGGATLSYARALPHHAGYSILMGLTTLFFGLGTYFVRKVRGVR